MKTTRSLRATKRTLAMKRLADSVTEKPRAPIVELDALSCALLARVFEASVPLELQQPKQLLLPFPRQLHGPLFLLLGSQSKERVEGTLSFDCNVKAIRCESLAEEVVNGDG